METLESYLAPIQSADWPPPQQRNWSYQRQIYDKSKRMIDLAVVLLAAPAVIAVIAFAAVAIAIFMGRPIFFVSERVGWKGRPFKMLKLRTMTNGGTRCATATLKDDPRITPLGKVLRRSHLDELPQLWNVFVGEMTLIGPRPEQPHLVAQYRERLPNYDLRHSVKPGLSGWAQVSFGYAADVAETQQKLIYDLEYVERFGPMIDLLTAVKTIKVYLNPRYVR